MPDDSLPQGTAKVRSVREMFDAIAPRYDLVNRILTFRMDVGWRRRTIAALGLGTGARVLDLAAGTGDLARELRQRGFRPLSFDLSMGMLLADRSGAPRVQADALRLPLPDAIADGAVCGFALRNFVELQPFFAELARVTRADGRVAMLEVATPRRRLLRAGHAFYFGKVVPFIGGRLSDPGAYRYLPRSVAYLPPGDLMLDQLRSAGFGDVERRYLSAGIAQLITATRA